MFIKPDEIISMRQPINSVADLLAYTKLLRGFDVNLVLQQKVEKINNFFRQQQLDSAVVGLSGGVDSALVFALLRKASFEKDSPIKKIVACVLPIECKGTTDQDTAAIKAINLVKSRSKSRYDEDIIELVVAPLEDVATAYVAQAPNGKSPWAIGQLASIIRTPFLYYQAAILQTRTFKSIVVGTTNRDEGAYIGFFGKASDAMVDLQPIADLHKSEVYLLAKELNVTEDILTATPKGDVWDGQTDEEMIGAPYWFIEMFLIMKDFNLWHLADELFTNNCDEWHDVYYKYSSAVESIHYKNKHKYEVGNPAHFIDVLQRKVEGGW